MATTEATSGGAAFHTSVIPDEQFYERQRRFHDFLDAPVRINTIFHHR